MLEINAKYYAALSYLSKPQMNRLATILKFHKIVFKYSILHIHNDMSKLFKPNKIS